jgi:uncharacterized damage-inducible protein DinB
MERLFLSFSSAKLGQLESRIQDCLQRLTPEQIWWRASEENNSVGNLVLHLCGNLRQWVVTGIGGFENVRDRAAEFNARGGATAQELQSKLNLTVNEAVTAMETVADGRLTERVRIQSFDVSVLEAIYHAVEHFSMHTGQIIYITKALQQQDLGYYKHIGSPDQVDNTP